MAAACTRRPRAQPPDGAAPRCAPLAAARNEGGGGVSSERTQHNEGSGKQRRGARRAWKSDLPDGRPMSYMPFGSADPSRVPCPPAQGADVRPRSIITRSALQRSARTGKEHERQLAARHCGQALFLPGLQLLRRGARHAGMRHGGLHIRRRLSRVNARGRKRLEDLRPQERASEAWLAREIETPGGSRALRDSTRTRAVGSGGDAPH